LKAYVTVGWKIYYPAERKIILDQVYLDSVFTEANGMSKVEAERSLPGIKNAIEDAGYIAGARFARRVSPRKTTVERKYFTSGNDDFKQANQFIEMRYWESAAEFWEKNMENPKPNIAGAARYNLALIHEMNGKLDEAIDLVVSAGKLYNHKVIKAYHQILNQRRSTQEPNPDMH
jgi:tetratricopeptide (TPR) repeat protein